VRARQALARTPPPARFVGGQGGRPLRGLTCSTAAVRPLSPSRSPCSSHRRVGMWTLPTVAVLAFTATPHMHQRGGALSMMTGGGLVDAVDVHRGLRELPHVLLDVRIPEDFEDGHLDGSINIPALERHQGAHTSTRP
jgi:hypothetical protein